MYVLGVAIESGMVQRSTASVVLGIWTRALGQKFIKTVMRRVEGGEMHRCQVCGLLQATRYMVPCKLVAHLGSLSNTLARERMKSISGLVKAFAIALLTCAIDGALGTEADPSLRRFVQDAVAGNPIVLAAQARVDASDARKAAAVRSFDNPQISFEAENGESQVRAVELSKTLDLGRKRHARVSVAQAERLALLSDYLQTRRTVALNVLQGLAEYRALIEQSVLAGRRVELMSQFAEFAEQRFDAGDLSLVELDLALLASVDAQMSEAMVAAELAQAREQLLALVTPAQSASTWPRLETPLPELAPDSVDLQSVLGLPGVVAARRRVEAAEAEVNLRRRERRPDPTVGLAAGSEGEHGLVAINVSIPVPILNRGRHEVSEATARHAEAQRLADDVRRRARAHLVGAAERYRATRGAWRDWTKLGRVSLERKSELLERLWSAGEIGTEQYLVQLEQSLDVQGNALELRYASWRAWFEWLVASGRMDDWLARGER